MNVASQLKATLNTEQYTERLYATARKNIMQSRTLTQDTQKAKKLERFLWLIKQVQKNPAQYLSGNSSLPFTKIWSIQEQQQLIQKLYMIKPELFTSLSNNFNAYENFTNQELGQSLEIGLARIVKSFQTISQGGINAQDYDRMTTSVKVGASQTQIPDLINMTDKVVESTFLEMYNYAAKEMKESGYWSGSDWKQYGTFIPKVAGKIDVKGLNGQVSISTTCTAIERDIIDCLKDATFTAKNYVNTYNIKFGQTNPFRVYMTIGGDYTRFYRMLNCFESHETSHSNAPKYFYKLRALYEITGGNMKYVDAINEKLGFAKYLVWNTPQTDEIRVIPTARIVKNIIDNIEDPADWKKAVYGPIHLLQQDLKNL